MKILIVNAGSSSLKYQVIDMEGEHVLAKGVVERINIEGSQLKHTKGKAKYEIKRPIKDHVEATQLVLATLQDPEMGVISSVDEIGAVGHRVLHGGERFTASLIEDFEVTDKINQTGYAHVVDPVFTGYETILTRAEAYIMKKEYDKALADMNTWLTAHCDVTSPKFLTLTVDNVNTALNAIRMTEVPSRAVSEESIKKPLNPQGFTVEEGTQTNMIYTVLQMRRITTIYQGQRWLDIKRWGIEFTHHLDGEDNLVFKAGDLRGAIQLPYDVIEAGLEPNPRETATQN